MPWDPMADADADPVLRRVSANRRNELLALPERDRLTLLTTRPEEVLEYLTPNDRSALFASVHSVATVADVKDVAFGKGGPVTTAAATIALSSATAEGPEADEERGDRILVGSLATLDIAADVVRADIDRVGGPQKAPNWLRRRWFDTLRARWVVSAILVARGVLDRLIDHLEEHGIDGEKVRARANVQLAEQKREQSELEAGAAAVIGPGSEIGTANAEDALASQDIGVSAVPKSQPFEMTNAGLVEGEGGEEGVGSSALATSREATVEPVSKTEKRSDIDPLASLPISRVFDVDVKNVGEALAVIASRKPVQDQEALAALIEYKMTVALSDELYSTLNAFRASGDFLPARAVDTVWTHPDLMDHPLRPLLEALAERRIDIALRVDAERDAFGVVLSTNRALRAAKPRIDADLTAWRRLQSVPETRSGDGQSEARENVGSGGGDGSTALHEMSTALAGKFGLDGGGPETGGDVPVAGSAGAAPSPREAFGRGGEAPHPAEKCDEFDGGTAEDLDVSDAGGQALPSPDQVPIASSDGHPQAGGGPLPCTGIRSNRSGKLGAVIVQCGRCGLAGAVAATGGISKAAKLVWGVSLRAAGRLRPRPRLRAARTEAQFASQQRTFRRWGLLAVLVIVGIGIGAAVFERHRVQVADMFRGMVLLLDDAPPKDGVAVIARIRATSSQTVVVHATPSDRAPGLGVLVPAAVYSAIERGGERAAWWRLRIPLRDGRVVVGWVRDELVASEKR
jgi:hypothetical protein